MAGEPGNEKQPPDPGAGRLGGYQLVRLLGRGSLGDAYLATASGAAAVVKVLREDLAADAGYVKSLHAAVDALRSLDHPSLVPVIAAGQEQGRHYVVTELVEGTNLAEYLRKKGKLDSAACSAVLRKLAQILDAAAQQGLVHGNLKLENVLLSRKGEIRLADLGLPRRLAGQKLPKSFVFCLSPEQLQGREPDARSDVYSLGVLAYHMLAGKPPFDGESAKAIAMGHLRETPISLAERRPEVPAPLVELIEKMMHKDPRQRCASAAVVLSALDSMSGKKAVALAATTPRAVPAPAPLPEIRSASATEDRSEIAEAVPQAPRAAVPAAVAVGEPIYPAREEEEEAAGAMWWKRRPRAPSEDLDLTSMVDVTFLLVLFFMLTATYTLQKSIAVPAPKEESMAKQAMQLEDLRDDFIIVTVQADGTILVDDAEVRSDRGAVVDALHAALRDTGNREVIIHGEDAALHENVVLVIDAASEVGMQRISLASAGGGD